MIFEILERQKPVVLLGKIDDRFTDFSFIKTFNTIPDDLAVGLGQVLVLKNLTGPGGVAVNEITI